MLEIPNESGYYIIFHGLGGGIKPVEFLPDSRYSTIDFSEMYLIVSDLEEGYTFNFDRTRYQIIRVEAVGDNLINYLEK